MIIKYFVQNFKPVYAGIKNPESSGFFMIIFHKKRMIINGLFRLFCAG